MSAVGRDIDVDGDTGELLMITDYQLVAMIGYEIGNSIGDMVSHMLCQEKMKSLV